ncbi:hypothetical protein F5883DRAFT_375815, partial [Diaporthe sp. PMI_573]
GLLTALVLVPSVAANQDNAFYSYSGCQPGGAFSAVNTWSAWNINEFFQITSGMGRLTFTQAKVVDVIWDVIVGRIGQTCLFLCSWKAFSLHIKASNVNPRPVTYNTFWTLFMSSEVSLSAVTGLIRDFSSRRSLKSKPVMIFMVFTTIFILAWPTMISAMTGYDTNNMPYVTIAVGEHMLFHYFDPVLYVIHDGSRLSGLTDEYKVPYCSFTPHNVQAHGFYGLKNATSTWTPTNTSLLGPVLNISAFYIDEQAISYGLYGRDWIDPRYNTTPFKSWKNMAYMYENETYNIKYLEDQKGAQCQQDTISGTNRTNQTYLWGFSFLQGMLSLTITSIWTAGVYIVWLNAHLKLSSQGAAEVPSHCKAALILSQCVAREFGDMDAAGSMSNTAFDKHVKLALKGGRVVMQPTTHLALGQRSSLTNSVKSWLKTEKCWVFLL